MSIKNKLNKYFRRFGVEIHGVNYLQALSKNDISKNEFDFIRNAYNTSEIVIYDVGANRGVMIEKFLNYFPKSTIHAFEPHKEFSEALITKFATNNKVRINQIGVSNQKGILTFNVNKSIDTSSFLSSKKTGLNSDAQVETVMQVEVPIINLDNYIQEQGHSKINLLKLDIQGSELNALKGAENLLKEGKIDFIFSETYFIQQYVDQPTFFDIANYLLPFGYVLQDIYNPIYGKGKLAWCDTLFVKADLKLI